MKVFFCLTFLFWSIPFLGQEQSTESSKRSSVIQDSVLADLEFSVEKFNSENPNEKIFLHTDRDLYSINENIFYSIYTVIGSEHHFSQESLVIHVDLIGPENEIIIAQTHEIFNGRGAGTLFISKNLQSGKYLLRSYTNWMRNFSPGFFFMKTIEVVGFSSPSTAEVDLNEKIDLQFFPEGGQLVGNLSNNVAFKAIGNDGLGQKISGSIVDSKGNAVAQFNSITRGMGAFPLRPKSNEQYIAVLHDGSKFNLPKVQDAGYTLNVDNFNPNDLIVHVQSTEEGDKSTFYLLGILRGKKEVHVKFDLAGKTGTRFKISKKDMRNGVLALTLFDSNRRAWCERLVFIDNLKKTNLTIDYENEKFEKREKLSFDLSLGENDENEILNDLSVSVTDLDRTFKNTASSNILTYLLLESDLRGFIEQPSLLFKNQKKPAVYALDLIMLTHGWRKYNWQAILAKKDTKKKFGFSKGIKLSGMVKTTKNKLFANNTLIIWAKSEQEMHSYQTQTDSLGQFLIDDFSLSGKTEIVFNGFDSKKRPLDIEVKLDTNKNILPQANYKNYLESENVKNVSGTLNNGQLRKDSLYSFEKTVKLEEVTVTEDKIKKRQPASPSVYGVTPDDVIYADEYANNRILQLINRFAGVRVTPEKQGEH